MKITKSNQILLPLVISLIILAIAGLLIACGCITPDDKEPVDNKKLAERSGDNNTRQNSSGNNSYSEKELGIIPDADTNLSQNTKPLFNVGDMFVYEFPHIPSPNLLTDDNTTEFFIAFFNESVECVLEYHVTDRIKIDDSSYFEIHENAPKCIVGVWNLKGVLMPAFTGKYDLTIYVNDDTGERFYIDEKTGKKEMISDCYWSGCGYASWMLGLKDNAKWREEIASSGNERTIYEFSVEGRENIGGRECFEVEKTDKECLNESCEIIKRGLYYIDVEKRVTLRYYLWYEDLPVRETRLIYQNYFNKTVKPKDYEIKINSSEYEKKMRLVNRIGYCEDGFCNPENNETMESCCMDCGCSEGKVCNGVCMQDNGSALKFSSEKYGFNITLPSGWRGKWRGDSIFFELASEPWTSVEVFFGSLTGKTPQYAYSSSDNLTAGNKNFTLIYSAPAQEDYENNLGLYEKIKSSFRGI